MIVIGALRLHALVQHRVRAVSHETSRRVHVAERARPVKRRLPIRVEHVDVSLLLLLLLLLLWWWLLLLLLLLFGLSTSTCACLLVFVVVVVVVVVMVPRIMRMADACCAPGAHY